MINEDAIIEILMRAFKDAAAGYGHNSGTVLEDLRPLIVRDPVSIESCARAICRANDIDEAHWHHKKHAAIAVLYTAGIPYVD